MGDTQGDLAAARFADIPFIYAEYGFGQVSEYDMKIKSFEELLIVFNRDEQDSEYKSVQKGRIQS
ncbi:hypothetical protein [Bacillus sp. ISL-55]|uniref:hypothetical protein n=1 Tax=Bacillus sp. ISL-55 TaxID=2819134 RepID=UPI00336BCFFF